MHVFWGFSKLTDQTFCGQTDLTFPFISDPLVDLGRVVIRTEWAAATRGKELAWHYGSAGWFLTSSLGKYRSALLAHQTDNALTHTPCERKPYSWARWKGCLMTACVSKKKDSVRHWNKMWLSGFAGCNLIFPFLWYPFLLFTFS